MFVPSHRDKPGVKGARPPGHGLTASPADSPPETADAEKTPGRLATEAALEEAAMALLRRDGVLAGLNLREVADAAGVNRGLVYHYYGSRAQLLRQALKRRGAATRTQLAANARLRFIPRFRAFFQTLIGNVEPVVLTTLLLLDGSEPLRVMPLREQTQAGLRRAVAGRELAPDTDLMALHALLVTGAYGYALYREAFAAELGVPVSELDGRVAALLFDRLLPTLAPPE